MIVPTVHVLMLSRLNASDGGREKWAHSFLPPLAETLEAHITVFGIEEMDLPRLAKSGISHRSAASEVSTHQFAVKRKRYPFFLQMMGSIVRYSWLSRKFERPNIVIAMGVFELIMMLTANYFGVKKVVWLRGIFLDEKASRYPKWLRSMLARIEAFLLRRADLVLANGTDIADHYAGRGLKLAVIENGVDIQKWGGEPPEFLRPISVAFVGRLARIKGIEEFISALDLVSRGPRAGDFMFHVVGDGPYSDEIARRAKSGVLTWHGAVDNADLPALLVQFDVCVALTWTREVDGGGGTSNALLEQIAASRLIVAWDNVIFSQVVDSECAILVPQGSIQGLVNAYYYAADNRDRVRDLANRAGAVATKFSLSNQVSRFVKLLHDTNIWAPI